MLMQKNAEEDTHSIDFDAGKFELHRINALPFKLEKCFHIVDCFDVFVFSSLFHFYSSHAHQTWSKVQENMLNRRAQIRWSDANLRALHNIIFLFYLLFFFLFSKFIRFSSATKRKP